jgi:hypothetical protein
MRVIRDRAQRRTGRGHVGRRQSNRRAKRN